MVGLIRSICRTAFLILNLALLSIIVAVAHPPPTKLACAVGSGPEEADQEHGHQGWRPWLGSSNKPHKHKDPTNYDFWNPHDY